jgi:hypothetical protein
MNTGKTLFAQVIDFLPWKTFQRIADRYEADHGVRTLSCVEQFRVMAFAQLCYRERLRDIEVGLAARASKLYHMGISQRIARSMPRRSICACRCCRGHSISMKPNRNPPKTICVPIASEVTDGMVIRIISLGTNGPNDKCPH